MTELRRFTGTDHYGFQGATDFPNGEKPMIAEGENAILIVSGFDSNKEFGIDIIANKFEAMKIYEDVERAISDAKIFSQTLDSNLTEEFFQGCGFATIKVENDDWFDSLKK